MDKAAPNKITTDAEKENRKRLNLLANNRKDTGGETKPFKDIAHDNPNHATSKKSRWVLDSPLMNYTEILESLDAVQASINEGSDDIMDSDMSSDSASQDTGMGMGHAVNNEELLEELNRIFTPILVMQGIEGDISDQIQEACSEDNILTERTIIRFDDSARMGQLRMVCALLIARQKNSEKYQTWKKASMIANTTKNEIQKEEYAAANALAQQYLVKVSTTNNSSVARDAAKNLLPATQY